MLVPALPCTRKTWNTFQHPCQSPSRPSADASCREAVLCTLLQWPHDCREENQNGFCCSSSSREGGHRKESKLQPRSTFVKFHRSATLSFVCVWWIWTRGNHHQSQCSSSPLLRYYHGNNTELNKEGTSELALAFVVSWYTVLFPFTFICFALVLVVILVFDSWAVSSALWLYL